MRKRNKISIRLTLEDANELASLLGNSASCLKCYEQLAKEIEEANEHNERFDRIEAEKKAKEEKLHTLFKMMHAARKRGEQRTVHFKPINMSCFTWDMDFVNQFQSPTKAKFHWYQPRKRVVWLQFEPGDIKRNQYDRNLFPFDLAEAVQLGFMSEETFNLKKDVV